jgi:mono/diheme cytochrome c family protein
MRTRKEVIALKTLKVVVLFVIALSLIGSVVFAQDVEKGKALFNDPKLGTTGKSCNSCHAGGAKLEKAAGKDDKALAETVNSCIVKSIKGKALDVNSEEMKNIVAYTKTLTAMKGTQKKTIKGC